MQRINRILFILPFLFILIVLSIVIYCWPKSSPTPAGPKDGFELFNDAQLTKLAKETFPWEKAQEGWNNETVWVYNNGSKPFLLGFQIVLPEGWNMTWDYHDQLIRPKEKLALTFFLYIAGLFKFDRVTTRLGIFALSPAELPATSQ